MADSRKRWEDEVVAKSLVKSPERRARFETTSGIPVERAYAGDDPAALGLPGEYPFTRGVQPTMYRSRFWTMRQYAGFSPAKESNERYRYLLERGTTGQSVAFDMPTQIGMDSDHPMAPPCPLFKLFYLLRSPIGIHGLEITNRN